MRGRLVIFNTYDIRGGRGKREKKLGQISEPWKAPPSSRYGSIPVETHGFSRSVIERLAKTALTNATKQKSNREGKKKPG